MKDGFVEVDGVRLHYVESGEGRPLVLVHGWGLNLHSWDAQIRFFQDRFRVVAYDWRGHGRSAETPPYAFADLARELEGLLERLGISSPILCGHSMGGTIVIEHATTFSRRVAALVLVDTNVPGTRWDRLMHWIRCEGSSFATEALGAAVGQRRALEIVSGVYGHMFWADPWRRDHAEQYAEWRRQFADGIFTGMINAYRASGKRTNPETAIRSLSVPALVVNGTADRVFRVRMAKRIAGLFEHGTLALVDGAGHMSMCEQPEIVNAHIDGFLRQVAAG